MKINKFVFSGGINRLDAYLSREMDYPRTMCKDLIKDGAVTVNGKTVKPAHMLEEGDVIEASLDTQKPGAGEFKSMILLEDKVVVAISKPGGLLVHPLSPAWEAAPELVFSGEVTLAAMILSAYPDLPELGVTRSGLVHRLDRETSGLLLVAKDLEQARSMAAACGAGWFCGSFAERYGTTIDAIMQQEGREVGGHSCRVLTNDLTGEIAEAQGVTKCAVATTVDDRAGRFFSDLVSGTIEHSLRLPGTLGKTRIPVIRPFMEIPAPEVIRYAELHPECAGCDSLPPGPCTDSDPGAADARAALDAYDARHPATKFALANLAGTLSGIAAAQGGPGRTGPGLRPQDNLFPTNDPSLAGCAKPLGVEKA